MSKINKLLFSVVNYTSAYNSFGEIPGYVPERRSISLFIMIFSLFVFNLLRKNKIEKIRFECFVDFFHWSSNFTKFYLSHVPNS